MGTTAEKLTYLNETKTQLKDMLNLGGASLTTEPFRQYVDTLKNRYLYFMNNGTQQVWDNWDKVNGTGETLTLNNTEEAPMSLVYKGNTLQNGTPTPEVPSPIQVVSGDNSIVVCGVNVFDEVIENGYINYQTGVNVAGDNYRRSKNFINVNPSTTYYLNMGEAPSGAWCGTIQYDKNKNFLEYKAWSKETTLTTRSDTEYIRFYLNATSYDKICINVSNASINGTYYSYTGESYPISLGGMNLIPFTNQDFTLNGLRYYVEDGSLYINGTSTGETYSTNANFKNNFAFTLQAGTYYLSITSDLTTYIDNKSTGTHIRTNAGAFTLNETTEVNLGFYVYQKSFTNKKFEIQLEKGSQATSYEPYNPNPIELLKIGTYQDKIDKSSGKNLLSTENIHNGSYTSIEELQNETYTETSNTKYRTIRIENLPAGTYTITINWSKTARILRYSTNGEVIGLGIDGNSYTFTTTTNSLFGLSFRSTDSVDFTDSDYKIMLNEGTTALEYEPYGTSWYVKKEIGKVILDGTQTTLYAISTTGRFYYSSSLIKDIAIENTGVICQNLKGVSYGELFSSSDNYLISQGGGAAGSNRIILKNIYDNGTLITTSTNLATWLSNNNVIVYYILNTPTYTLIEDSTLIEELESMKKSYENQTNISQENNDMPFILDITALSK